MRSYAAIDHSGPRFAVCEVENLETIDSRPETLFKERLRLEIDVTMIQEAVGSFEDSDILVVEHEGEIITRILSSDEMTEYEKGEKQRRLDYITSLMNS